MVSFLGGEIYWITLSLYSEFNLEAETPMITMVAGCGNFVSLFDVVRGNDCMRMRNDYSRIISIIISLPSDFW